MMKRTGPVVSILLWGALGACGADTGGSSPHDPADAERLDGNERESFESGSDLPRGADTIRIEEGDDVSALLPPDPELPGPFSCTQGDFALPVGKGATKIPLHFSVPDGEGPFPVVVFIHGFSLKGSSYGLLRQHLCSWGYVAILPDMPGTMFSPATHLQLAQYTREMLDWVEEAGGNAAEPLKAKADSSRIGLSGHSMGGKIAMLVASQDSRVKASFTLDAVDSGAPSGDLADYPSVTPELMPKILIPLGLLGETLDSVPLDGMALACAPAEQNFEQYYVNAVSPAIRIEMVGAGHMQFLDNSDCGIACSFCQKPLVDASEVRSLSHGYLVAFYNVYLGGQKEYLAYLVGTPMKLDIQSGKVASDCKNGFY